MRSNIEDWPIVELLSASSLICCAAWIAGVFLNFFGGTLGELGAIFCIFAMYVGTPLIMITIFVISSAMAQYMRPWYRRLVFYLGFFTLFDIVCRGFMGLRYWFKSKQARAIAFIPFLIMLAAIIRILRRRGIHLSSGIAIGFGIGIGLSAVLLSILVLRIVALLTA